ncbi:pre-B-cell leukemia transcription factor-interacting protein 1-like, partial [Diretmus argenteus]
DFDTSEVSDGEQNQDWLNGDPQDMKELLDKLAQENQQISQLETQLQSQKKELDSALKEAAAKGDGEGKDLEKENAKMKEELSSLPGLKEELETLRARVTELTQLTANQDVPVTSAPGPGGEHGESNQDAAEQERRRKDSREGGRLKEELQRQKVLLDESGKRLEGMKRDGGDRKGVRESLEKIQKRLSEQVEKLGKKKPWEAKRDGNRGKGNGRDHWKKEEKKEWRGEKDWKKEHSKEGGRRDKDERREKDWKSHKQNSHKEAWRTYQDEWERKKDERRTDREERRKEKPWRSAAKDTHSHNQQHQHQQHQPRQPHQHNHNDFWRHQEEKLTRNVHPRTGCSTVEDCANKEGLYPVELSEFEELLEGYLSKLEGSPPESKDELRKLAAKFFQDGVFLHDRVAFSDFAEDVADILEDMADSLEDEGQEDEESEALEEEMEEFEREALWKFAVTA